MLLFAGCMKEYEYTSPIAGDTVLTRNIPSGNIPTPAWNVDTNYDFSNSMTAVVAVDLKQTYPDVTPADWQVGGGDLMGVFDGIKCIGVTEPTDGLFFLYITSPTSSNAPTRLQYYSARLHNIFQADTVLHFENGARLGSVTDPITPAFTE